MSTPTAKHLSVQELTEAAKEEMKNVALWLEQATFDARGDFEQCSDNDGLVNAVSHFLRLFPLSHPANQTRITAFRFKKPATLPVSPGAIILIPAKIISGEPKVSSVKIEDGIYVHLERNTDVQPSFCCLSILLWGAQG
ncbi:hypothetical protein K469DRAFT_347055 [Zopfia rhizophila CBS 207.26]|uniref:Uncharacterized protein n=1 Tax=Zopfia rhizophila CBS 207.26 TaxID=1314779 RepID=A0A6A6EMR8_9PEZI|nr:hypothetical protein K469DRAFT_347055 [Zopfia rhizophila CBS 207.26]